MSNRKAQFWSKRNTLGVLGLALFLLNACGPQSPIQITDLSVDGEPWVSEVVTLHIEVKSMFDEPDAAIIVDLPPGVKLMDGELLWEGSLRANQPQTHELSLCVLYEGDWRLWIATSSQLAENSSYGDTETLHLITTGDTVRVVPGGAYRITQPPEGMVIFPTSLPETPPADVCP